MGIFYQEKIVRNRVLTVTGNFLATGDHAAGASIDLGSLGTISVGASTNSVIFPGHGQYVLDPSVFETDNELIASSGDHPAAISGNYILTFPCEEWVYFLDDSDTYPQAGIIYPPGSVNQLWPAVAYVLRAQYGATASAQIFSSKGDRSASQVCYDRRVIWSYLPPVLNMNANVTVHHGSHGNAEIDATIQLDGGLLPWDGWGGKSGTFNDSYAAGTYSLTEGDVSISATAHAGTQTPTEERAILSCSAAMQMQCRLQAREGNANRGPVHAKIFAIQAPGPGGNSRIQPESDWLLAEGDTDSSGALTLNLPIMGMHDDGDFTPGTDGYYSCFGGVRAEFSLIGNPSEIWPGVISIEKRQSVGAIGRSDSKTLDDGTFLASRWAAKMRGVDPGNVAVVDDGHGTTLLASDANNRVYRVFDPAAEVAAWRWMKVRIQARDSGSYPYRLRLRKFLYHDTFYSNELWVYWDLTTSNSDVWVDLAHPMGSFYYNDKGVQTAYSEALGASTGRSYNAPDNPDYWLAIPQNAGSVYLMGAAPDYELGSVAFFGKSWYYGWVHHGASHNAPPLEFDGLPNGVKVDVYSISLETREAATAFFSLASQVPLPHGLTAGNYYNSFWRKTLGFRDGKQSYEVPMMGYLGRTLGDYLQRLNQIDGWSFAVTPFSGSPLCHSGAPAYFLGGINGAVFDQATGWVDHTTIAVPDPATPKTVYAQTQAYALFTYPGNDNLTVDILGQRGLFLAGSVTDELGSPASGQTIILSDDGGYGTQIASDASDAQGVYQHDNPPGIGVRYGTSWVNNRKTETVQGWAPAASELPDHRNRRLKGPGWAEALFQKAAPAQPIKIVADSPRSWLHVTKANVIRTYDLAAYDLAFQSDPNMDVDTYTALRVDPRRADLYALGQKGVSPYAYHLYASKDGGISLTEILTLTARSQVIQTDSLRGLIVTLWENSGNIQRQESQDGGATWSAATQPLYLGVPFSGILLDMTLDSRLATMVLAVTISGSNVLLASSDLGVTWELKLS